MKRFRVHTGNLDRKCHQENKLQSRIGPCSEFIAAQGLPCIPWATFCFSEVTSAFFQSLSICLFFMPYNWPTFSAFSFWMLYHFCLYVAQNHLPIPSAFQQPSVMAIPLATNWSCLLPSSLKISKYHICGIILMN